MLDNIGNIQLEAHGMEIQILFQMSGQETQVLPPKMQKHKTIILGGKELTSVYVYSDYDTM